MEPYNRSTRADLFWRWDGEALVSNYPGPSVSKETYTDRGTLTPVGRRNFSNGFKNPAFRDEIRRATNATTDVTAQEWSARQGWHSYNYDYLVVNSTTGAPIGGVKGSFGYNLQVWPFSILDSPDNGVTSRVLSRAVQDFLDDIDAKSSAFEAGQDIGEYKETLHSIRHPLQSLRDKVLNYFTLLTKVKRSYYNPISLRKALTDTYLEWRFGINPLVSDVADAIVKCGSHRFPIVPVHGHAKETWHSTRSSLDLSSQIPSRRVKIVATYAEDSVYEVRLKGGYKTGSDAQGRVSLFRDLQLTPDKWLPTAWDLLPYSWIADYFTNIGTIIRGLSFCTSNLAWGAKTVRNLKTGVISNFAIQRLPPGGSGVKYSFWSGNVNGDPSSSFTVKSVTRTSINANTLAPPLVFTVPTGKWPYINMSALLLQRAKKLVPFF